MRGSVFSSQHCPQACVVYQYEHDTASRPARTTCSAVSGTWLGRRFGRQL